MNNDILGSTRLIDITIDDLRGIIQEEIKSRGKKEPDYLYGPAGIASIFNCSISTAHRIKKSGILDEAISQVGCKYVIDKKRALQIAKNYKHEK